MFLPKELVSTCADIVELEPSSVNNNYFRSEYDTAAPRIVARGISAVRPAFATEKRKKGRLT